MALGLEERNLVHPVDHQPEPLARDGGRVEGDRPIGRPVNAAQVDGQLAVDVHPDVVVTGKVELLAPLVSELVAQLAGEVEVAADAVVVVVELTGGGARVPPQVIERVEVGIAVLIDDRSGVGGDLGEQERRGVVHRVEIDELAVGARGAGATVRAALFVVVPPVERGRALDVGLVTRPRRALEDRFPSAPRVLFKSPVADR